MSSIIIQYDQLFQEWKKGRDLELLKRFIEELPKDTKRELWNYLKDQHQFMEAISEWLEDV